MALVLSCKDADFGLKKWYFSRTKFYAMDKHFEISMQNRKFLYSILKDTPKEVLCAIPSGFKNNIWWNICHTVVVQQGLIYGLSGLPYTIPEELAEKYKKGTRPEDVPEDAEIEQMKKLLFSTQEKIQEDYAAGKFKDYKAYETSVKITLNDIEEAIIFNGFHEGIHLGTVLALLKAVQHPKAV
jgi:hypothetical protein